MKPSRRDTFFDIFENIPIDTPYAKPRIKAENVEIIILLAFTGYPFLWIRELFSTSSTQPSNQS